MTLDTQRAIDQLSKKTKMKSIRIIKMKIRLNPTTCLLLIQVSLRLKSRLRPSKKINITNKTVKEIIQLLKSIPIRLQKKTRIKTKLRIWATSNVTSKSRKITALINVPKSQKTYNSLDNLHINNWKKRGKIRINIWYYSINFKN